jgi:hypothetical protein
VRENFHQREGTMAEKKMSGSQPRAVRKDKPRKHGYRGYGSGFSKGAAGTVHWGRGFGGVEPLGVGSGARLPKAELFSEDLKERK